MMGFLESSLANGERRLLFKNAHSGYRDTVGRTEMWLNTARASRLVLTNRQVASDRSATAGLPEIFRNYPRFELPEWVLISAL